MGTYLHPSTDDFDKLISDQTFVDHTEMLENISNRINGSSKKYIAVLRPEGFGKTIDANMVAAFFDKDGDMEAFKDLAISNFRDTCQMHQGQYNVIKIDMSKGIMKHDTIKPFVQEIASDILSELRVCFPGTGIEKEDRLYMALSKINNKIVLSNGERHREQFVIVIDDWDVPLRLMKHDADGQLYYITWLNDLFKGQDYLALAYMTGILPIKKCGDDSLMNMFNEYSMIYPGAFAPYAIAYEGKFYKISGSTLREVKGFDLHKILLGRAGNTWDSLAVPGVGVEDLDHNALMEFRKKAVKNNRMKESDANVSDAILLHNLKLFDGDYLTCAAVMLFHPEPDRFVTGAYIKIGYFGSRGITDEEGNEVYDLQYYDDIDGPLISQVDKTIKLLYGRYFKAFIDYEGIQRVETFMVDRSITRELLLNAINHKDYATGVPIQISVYDDHFEIFNMGEWPSRIPTDDSLYSLQESIPRNIKLSDISYRSGDVEAWGRGFSKIKMECLKTKTPLPIVEKRGLGVVVVARGCEQYIRLLRYGQEGIVGFDGKRRNQVHETVKATKDVSDQYFDFESREFKELMEFVEIPRTRQEMQDFCGIANKDTLRRKVLNPLVNAKKIRLTIPEKPRSSKQMYQRY